MISPWWRWIPGRRRGQWKLEQKRVESISSISGEKLAVELMAQRPREIHDPLDNILLARVLQQFAVLEQKASQTPSIDELDDLVLDSESQSTDTAYLCPANEIYDEARRAIDNLELWGIPAPSIKKLRDRFLARLESPTVPPLEKRGALHSIFIEVDEWSDYIDEYEDTMRLYTHRLFGSTVFPMIAALVCLNFASHFAPLFSLGLLLAGAAGSSASVIAKMPALEVSLSGELDAYGRRIWSRITVGTTASLIGCGLLSWGILPIAMGSQSLNNLLACCSVSPVTTPPAARILVTIAVSMLLGFSERTLASFEQTIFGHSKPAKR